MSETEFQIGLGIVKKSDRVKKAIEKYEMTPEDIKASFHILLSMYKEEQMENKPSFYSDVKKMDDGRFVRIMIPNTTASEANWENNIISSKIIPFNEARGDVNKLGWRVEVLNHFRTMVEGKHNQGIYLYGKPSSGKTFFFKRFATSLAKKGNTVAYANVPALWDRIQKSIRENKNSLVDKVIETFSSADYLFLDDIGSENVNAWFRDSILFIILDRRMENNKTNFFTSNLTLDKLEKVESKPNKSIDYSSDQHKAQKLIGRIQSNTKIFGV